MPKHPASIRQIMSRQSALNRLAHRSARHTALLRLVQEVLPSPINKHCIACAETGERLTLYVRNAAWAAQIRYHNTAILAHLHQSGAIHFQTIRIRIQAETLPTNTQKRQAPISPCQANIDLLQTSADSLSAGQLKTALLRLAKRLQQNS